MKRPASGSAPRVPGRRLLTRLVLPGQDALAEGGPHDLGHALLLRRRDDLALDDPPQHRVLGLVADQLDAELAGQCSTTAISSARHSETPR